MIDDEERALFRAEMASVKPLTPSGKRHRVLKKSSANKRVPASVPISTPARMPKQSASTLALRQQNFLTRDDMGVEWMSSEQVLTYCSSGISAQLFKQLRLGKLTIEAVLDLHGDTVDSACERLFQFMQRAQSRHCRLVKIIHGKGLHAVDGTARLKSHVAKWLQQFDCVLAFHSAPASLGGRGAVLVMLRRESQLPCY
jgi:DNA-nicking Smr family endonuclease